MDVGLQRAAEFNFDICFLAEVHLDRDRNGTLQVKRHAGYECVSSLTEGTKVVGYVASELMGSMEVLWEENNMMLVKVGGVRVGGVLAARVEIRGDQGKASRTGTEVRRRGKGGDWGLECTP